MERLHVDAAIIRSFRRSKSHVSYCRSIPDTLAFQSSQMAKLLNYLFFVINILFLLNYCVKYYDYIVEWFSGVACN